MVSPNCLTMSFWKHTVASMASRFTVMEHVSNSFWSMRSIVLTLKRPSMYLCMLCAFNSKSYLVASHLSYSKYSSISSQTWFLGLALVREPTDEIWCFLTNTSKLLYNRTYDACLLPINADFYSLFWINIQTLAFSSSPYGFILFSKSSGAPLYRIVNSCTWVMEACIFLRFWENSLLCCCRPCKQTNSLCVVTNPS